VRAGLFRFSPDCESPCNPTPGIKPDVTGRLDQRSWATDDHTCRSKVEIVAEDIGASPRFATFDTHRVIRHRADDEPKEAPEAI